MRGIFLITVLIFPLCGFADPAEALLETLIGEAWAPQTVRVEWTFREKAPSVLSSYTDWRLSDPRPTRLAGSMIVSLQRTAADGTLQKTAVSGTCRVFGRGLTVKARVDAGQKLDRENLQSIEAELTRLNGERLASIPAAPCVAVRALVPGRVILAQDVKNPPLVRSGSKVSLVYAEGHVLVRLNGRALQDGAAGEVITVAADLGRSRSYKGTVAPDGAVHLIR